MRNTKTSLTTPRARANNDRPLTTSSDAEAASNLLRTASDPLRLSLLLALAKEDLRINELVDSLDKDLPTLSPHLALLRHLGLITSRRQGKETLYSLSATGRGISAVTETLLSNEQLTVSKDSISIAIERKLLEDVRGFVDDPEEWFRTPNAAFEGRQPIELLGTADEPRLRNRIEAAKLGMFS